MLVILLLTHCSSWPKGLATLLIKFENSFK